MTTKLVGRFGEDVQGAFACVLSVLFEAGWFWVSEGRRTRKVVVRRNHMFKKGNQPNPFRDPTTSPSLIISCFGFCCQEEILFLRLISNLFPFLLLYYSKFEIRLSNISFKQGFFKSSLEERLVFVVPRREPVRTFAASTLPCEQRGERLEDALPSLRERCYLGRDPLPRTSYIISYWRLCCQEKIFPAGGFSFLFPSCLIIL